MFAIFRPAKALFMNSVLIISLAGVMLVAAASQSSAQNSTELMATYGRGVHAYFNGQVHEADRLFSQVINGGSSDPRVFYFRAMARIRAGRTYEAEDDMRIGAAYEARNPGYGSTISRALQRVQGPNRRKLEEFRRQARLNQVSERRMMNRSRYEQLKRREPKVLRNEVSVPLEELTNPDMSFPGAAGTTVPPDGSSPQPTSSTPPDPVDSSDPFGGSEEPVDDVFGSPDEAGQVPTEEEDPFGGTESDDDDPFGAPESEDDDPFSAGGSASDDGERFAAAAEAAPTSSPPGELGEEDKVSPQTMIGVLGRIALGLNPARGLELPMPAGPGLAAPPNAGPGSGNEFGGADNFEAQASFEQEMGSDEGDDPFADDSDDAFGSTEAGSDAFGFGPEESAGDTEESSPDPGPSEDFDDDDPFAF